MRSRIREMFGPDWEEMWGRNVPSASWPALSPSATAQSQPQHHAPFRRQREPAIRVDVSETPEFFIVRADVPGCPKENIRLQVDEFQKSLLIDANAKNPEVHLESCPAHGQGQSSSRMMQEQSGESAQQSAQSAQSRETGQQSRESGQRGQQSQQNPQSQQSQQNPQSQQTSESFFPGTRSRSESSEQQQQQQQQPQEQGMRSFQSSKSWERAENLHLNERRTGLLHRTIRLPKNVDTSCLCTSLENGVLTVMFEKTKEPEHVRTVTLQ